MKHDSERHDAARLCAQPRHRVAREDDAHAAVAGGVLAAAWSEGGGSEKL